MNLSNILFIASYPPPFGGIASHMNDMVEIFKAKKTKLVILDKDKKKRIEAEYLLVLSPQTRGLQSLPVYIKAGLNLFKAISMFKTLGSLCNLREKIKIIFLVFETSILIKSHKIKIVSTYHVFPEGIIGYFVKKYLNQNIKLAITVFGELQAEIFNLKTNFLVFQSMLSCADLLLASSIYCAKGVEKLGIDSNRVKVVPYGIDLIHFQRNTPYSEELKRNTLLFVGHINQRMGLGCLIEAMDILVQKKSFDVNLRIVGNDFGYLLELTKKIRMMRLEKNISIHQKVSYNELKIFYNTSYIYVNTSNTKLPCMGLSMKEAMACELPVIASNAGGIPEAIEDGVSGFIFETDNHVELADKIILLLNDFKRAKQMGWAGKKRAEVVFDKDKSCERIFEYIENA